MASKIGVPYGVHQDTNHIKLEAHEQIVSSIPDEQDHPALAPTSEQAEEDLDIENHSPSDNTNEPEGVELREGSQDEDDVQVLGEGSKVEVLTISSESEKEVLSGVRQGTSSTCNLVSIEFDLDSTDLDSDDEVDQKDDEVD